MPTNTAVFPQSNNTGTAVNKLACVIGVDDAPSNTVLLFTAGASGSEVTRIVSIPRATFSSTAMYLFLSKDGGVTKHLIDSELMIGVSISATTVIPETEFTNYTEDTPLRLEYGDELYIGASVALAAGIVTRCEAMDF